MGDDLKYVSYPSTSAVIFIGELETGSGYICYWSVNCVLI